MVRECDALMASQDVSSWLVMAHGTASRDESRRKGRENL